MNEKEKKELIKSLTPKIHNPKFDSLGLVGLENLGNTCYLNCVIQSLSNTLPLTKHLLEGNAMDYLTKNCQEPTIMLMVSFIRLLFKLWHKEPHRIEDGDKLLFHFVKVFLTHFPEGGVFRQNDAQETLVFILDTFHTLLSRRVNYRIKGKPESEIDNLMIQSIKEWSKHYNNTHSFILELFGGQDHLKLQCIKCKTITQSFPASMYTMLTIPNGAQNLYDCLDYQSNVEQLDSDNEWKCDHCHQYSQAYKRTTYWKLPNILIITLNRFVPVNHGANYLKNNRLIEYPVRNLNLGSYVSNLQNSHIYDLYSVICHNGGPDSGHYYSFNLNENGSWYFYNDEQVKKVIDPKNVVSQQAYILFYRRVD